MKVNTFIAGIRDKNSAFDNVSFPALLHLCAKLYKSTFQKYHQASFKAITTSLTVIAGPYVSGQITLYYGSSVDRSVRLYNLGLGKYVFTKNLAKLQLF